MQVESTKTAGAAVPEPRKKAFNPVLAGVLQLVYFFISISYAVRFYYHQAEYLAQGLYRYHHRNPQAIREDVTGLQKVPRHIAVVLDKKDRHVEGGGIDGLLNDAGEIASWCVAAGASELSIYERSGALKKLPIADVFRAVEFHLKSYYGANSAPSVRVISRLGEDQRQMGPADAQLTINLVSEENGRKLIVNVARALAEMTEQGQFKVEDITLDVIDTQLKERVGGEPDLLIMFSPRVELQGYPPWHLRVTEMFYLPDNDGVVSYLVFLKALQKFSSVKINLGR